MKNTFKKFEESIIAGMAFRCLPLFIQGIFRGVIFKIVSPDNPLINKLIKGWVSISMWFRRVPHPPFKRWSASGEKHKDFKRYLESEKRKATIPSGGKREWEDIP